MTSVPASHPRPLGVQRQISLPLIKALEISYKNIRMRLSRSLLVTSGIVLALAFLMSILTSDALTNGMRSWVAAAPSSPRMKELERRRDALDAQRKPIEAELHAAPHAAGSGKFDAKAHFKLDLAELQKQTGPLPMVPAELEAALGNCPDLVPRFDEWVRISRELEDAQQKIKAPQVLSAKMQANGVPTTPQEIESNRIQTRWLLSLALLVAFVGILNAMLMSVTERFREIGTMKCLGALDGFIVKLFLLESLYQGLVGTVLGVLCGWLLSLLATWTSYGEFTWKANAGRSIGMAALLCLLVGVGLTVAAAVYPAWQAARMQPIDAMRVEA